MGINKKKFLLEALDSVHKTHEVFIKTFPKNPKKPWSMELGVFLVNAVESLYALENAIVHEYQNGSRRPSKRKKRRK